MRGRVAASALALFVLGGGTIEAQDDDALPRTADAAADLGKALAAWDHRATNAFNNTIPFEQAVLRAAAEGTPEALVPYLKHERYGALLFAALCERRPKGAVEAEIAASFAALPADRRLESALAVAALGTEPARAELRKLASSDECAAPGPQHDTIRAALVRAGDPAALKELRAGLASKDANEVAKALLLAGDARAVEFVGEAARLADDPRPLAAPVSSHWSETRTTTSADGNATTSETVPVNLKTVGEAALEAASRLGMTTLPDSVSWWYELEKSPRFGQGADAVKRLRQFAAADAKAHKAKAVGGFAAVAAVQDALRPTAPEMAEWKLESIAFDRDWTVEYTLGDAAGRATVDAAGMATRR